MPRHLHGMPVTGLISKPFLCRPAALNALPPPATHSLPLAAAHLLAVVISRPFWLLFMCLYLQHVQCSGEQACLQCSAAVSRPACSAASRASLVAPGRQPQACLQAVSCPALNSCWALSILSYQQGSSSQQASRLPVLIVCAGSLLWLPIAGLSFACACV